MNRLIFLKSFFLKLWLLSTFLLFLFCYPLFSQTLNLNQFGIEEGLPQSSIYTMLQDADGNIWVGTMNGVSKYNGLKFENYDKHDGLAENRVTSSCLDVNGDIWFGHWSGGISKYNASTKQFEEIIPGKISIVKTINSIFRDKEGSIWFGTEGDGILKYRHGKFTHLTTKDGLTGNIVNAFMEDNTGAIWIGTTHGITISNGQTFTTYKETLPSESIRTLLLDSKKNIWIGTTDKGVIRINADKQMQFYNQTNGLADNFVRVIFEDANGNIFLGTYGGGVSKYLPQLEANHYKGPIFQTISTKQGLSNDKVLSIIQDREKNIWIGTYLNLNQYFDEQFEIYGNNEGLDNSLIWSVIQDRTGNYWIGTEGGLVEMVPKLFNNDSKNKPEEELKYKFIKLTGKEGEVLNTSALYEDIKGNIWYTDFGHGLSRISPTTKKIDYFTVANKELPVNEIYCIQGDKDGNIWIGTNKGGVLKFDITTEKFTRLTKQDGIGSNQIYTIYRDSKNRMWFGTLSGALTMYDGKSFKTFTTKDGYPSKFTLCITEDHQGNIWLGTFDMGIYKYDGDKFKNYSTKEGLSSNTPFLLISDNNNNLWIGTGLGVDRFNLTNETIKHYEKEDGFLGVEINPNATCKDKDGNLWFGSIIGLVKYTSKNERKNLVEPITTIKPPRLFFQKIEIPNDHVFSWNQNHFTFDFVGTSLTNPHRVKYRYMLDGLDTGESPIVNTNSITYPHLAPGQYTFKVRSCNNDGVWNKMPVVFHFTITPPFWQMKWFWVLMILLCILFVIVFIRWREQKLKKENIILEQKVNERTETIQKQNIDLEKKNEKITDSIDYAKRIQQAVFVSSDEIKSYPFESFLLFKPKDIVSGDFYWNYKKDNTTYFIAAADCTGHGVPGAFMSLIGYNMLNYAIKDLGLEKPSAILSTLRNLIRDTLNGNSETEQAMKDGIAIAFCHIDLKKMQLCFSGSYNPLYHVHAGMLTEYKGDRTPIGHAGERETMEDDFTDHCINIQKGDMIYIFSDGYPDQTGGINKKKFYYAPFKELLIQIHQLPVEEQQKKLDTTITEWMDGREQLDDITIIGIKF